MIALILEDELLAARRLAKLLGDLDATITIARTLTSVSEAIAYLRQQPALDLIFSDIRLSDGLSFEIFRQVEPLCPIIFTTAYNEYAVHAFKLNSLDYLLKPIVPAELAAALVKYRKTTFPPPLFDFGQLATALSQSQRTYRQRFLITYRDTYLTIPAPDVAYFYSENKITRLVCPDDRWFPLPETLDQLAEQLDPQHFFRANRQCIISVGSIAAIHKHFNGRLKLDLRPAAPDSIFVSRERADGIKEWLNR